MAANRQRVENLTFILPFSKGARYFDPEPKRPTITAQ